MLKKILVVLFILGGGSLSFAKPELTKRQYDINRILNQALKGTEQEIRQSLMRIEGNGTLGDVLANIILNPHLSKESKNNLIQTILGSPLGKEIPSNAFGLILFRAIEKGDFDLFKLILEFKVRKFTVGSLLPVGYMSKFKKEVQYNFDRLIEAASSGGKEEFLKLLLKLPQANDYLKTVLHEEYNTKTFTVIRRETLKESRLTKGSDKDLAPWTAP